MHNFRNQNKAILGKRHCALIGLISRELDQSRQTLKIFPREVCYTAQNADKIEYKVAKLSLWKIFEKKSALKGSAFLTDHQKNSFVLY